MKKYIKSFSFVVIASLLALAPMSAQAGGFGGGYSKYQNKDYSGALKDFERAIKEAEMKQPIPEEDYQSEMMAAFLYANGYGTGLNIGKATEYIVKASKGVGVIGLKIMNFDE